MRFMLGALLCGFFMFMGWSAVFPGYLVEAEANMTSRVVIFCISFFLDAFFITTMYQDFCEYLRLKKKLTHGSN